MATFRDKMNSLVEITDEPKKDNDNSKPIQNASRIQSGRLADQTLVYQHNRRQIIEPEQSMQFCASSNTRVISKAEFHRQRYN
jgi:hypothetical protein